MLSEGNTSSCMRFCVVVVISTIMANFTFMNIYSIISTGAAVPMEIQDIISMLGVLGLKVGQKKLENAQTP